MSASVPLEHIPLFEGLDADILQQLGQFASVRNVSSSTLLYQEGDPPDHLYILLSGLVELFTGLQGRHSAILILWPPEPFLAAAALTEEPYLMSARTLGSARLMVLEAAAVRAAAARSAELSNRFTQLLAGQFRMVVRGIKDLRVRSGPCRVGAFLLRLVKEAGEDGFADLPISKGVLASRLGLTPESLSRALGTLKDHGLTVRGTRVILTDEAKLAAYCGPDPLIDGRELGLSVTAT